jgi:lysyl-tRNA synthetase class 1
MFWGDRIIKDVKEKYASEIQKGTKLIIRDEKTLSGRVHVGSMRGIAIHGIMDELCKEAGIDHEFLFEFNDYDPMDGLPVYLDAEKYKEHMGKPLCNVPSPDGIAANYAEYFGAEFAQVIESAGFHPKYYRSSELYKTGKYNEAIRLTLENAGTIRDIYKKVSGSVRADDWLPLSVVCEKCGKVGTTKARNFDGKTVEYTCGKFVDWADGCDYSGRIDPYDGRAKLPWKVEWAAKFFILGVHVEGGGKDHSTKGGSREVAETICREVFKHEPPVNIPYEFFQVGGKKMSSSKGAGSSSKEIADLLPPELFRFLLIQKEPNKVIEFDPEGDTVPILFDNYDSYSKKYFTTKHDAVTGWEDDFARAFYLAQVSENRASITERHLPRFSTVAFISQMPHVDPAKEIEKLQEITLTEDDKKELAHRIEYVRRWVADFAPDEYKFEIQENAPESSKNFSEIQKQALSQLLQYIESTPALDGQGLHTKMHEIKESTGIDPKEFFTAIYISILNRTSGPKAGWFLSVLDREFLIKRLKEVV